MAFVLDIISVIGIGVLTWLHVKTYKEVNNTKEQLKGKSKELEAGVNDLIEFSKKRDQLADINSRKLEKAHKEHNNELKEKIKYIRQEITEISQKLTPISQVEHRTVVDKRQHNPSSLEQYSSANISKKQSYISCYNNNQSDFKNNYQITAVIREAENFNQSHSGQTESVILSEDRQGNFWVFSDNKEIYVVPQQNLKINENRINSTKDLFDCQDYSDQNYASFTLVKPAVVVSKGDGIWKLQDKGILRFG